MNSKSLRILTVVMLMFAFMTFSLPSGADLAEDIEELEKEQEQVRQEKSEQAKSVDIANAEAAELTETLRVLNEQVNTQQAKIDTAVSLSAQTEQRGIAAKQEAIEIEASIAELEVELAELAIGGFKNQNLKVEIPGIDGEDSSDAIAKEYLSKTATRSELEAAEELRQSKADLESAVVDGEQAATELAALKVTLDEEQQKLTEARDAQAKVAQEAEERLEAELSEAAVLDDQDQALADSIREKNNPVAEQTGIANRNQAPSSSGPAPAVPGPPSGEIVKVTNHAGATIEVDSSIAPNVQAMFDDSAAAGLKLGGWGYRSGQRQIELRIQNCGGNSNYAIYEKPSSQCRPPTARPGRSNHERGLAIDITSGGSTIKSRNSAAFKWLQANASRYGLKNLPSEPWHWSINGK